MYRWGVPPVLVRRLVWIRERTGVPVARQLCLVVVEYLDQHELPTPAAPRAARTTTITASRGGSNR
jgi:hypothetical protein